MNHIMRSIQSITTHHHCIIFFCRNAKWDSFTASFTYEKKVRTTTCAHANTKHTIGSLRSTQSRVDDDDNTFQSPIHDDIGRTNTDERLHRVYSENYQTANTQTRSIQTHSSYAMSQESHALISYATEATTCKTRMAYHLIINTRGTSPV